MSEQNPDAPEQSTTVEVPELTPETATHPAFASELGTDPKYTLSAAQIETTACCGADPQAVYYNPYNKVIQCHQCGHVYVPLAVKG